jgi:DNA-binding transcriptional MocR family regulator
MAHDVQCARQLTSWPSIGVHCVPGTSFFAGGGGEKNLRLAFSFVRPDEIERGVAVLAQIICEIMIQRE